MSKLILSPIEEIALRNEVDRKTLNGEAVLSNEACKVCSTPMLSLVVVTQNSGVVKHLSCSNCGERDIKNIS